MSDQEQKEYFERQWIVEAWCRSRGALRDFAVAKMEDVRWVTK